MKHTHTSSRPQKKAKGKLRGLALLALLLAVGLIGWQASKPMLAASSMAAAAAAVESSRLSLDTVVDAYRSQRTRENWQAVEDARQIYETAYSKAVEVNAVSATPMMASSAALQTQTLRDIKLSLTATQKKISSRLLFASRKRRGTLPPELGSMRTSIATNATGAAVVNITVVNRIAGLKMLDQFGFKVINAANNSRLIVAEVPLDKLEELAAAPGVIAIREHIKAYVNRMERLGPVDGPADGRMYKPGLGKRLEAFRTRLLAALAINVSEGDKTHRAESARGAFGVNGTGVKVGVLSDGVDSLAALQATGDLPPGVTILPGQAGSGDEGSAMLEIIHDLAPGAQLYFAGVDPDQAQFAQNIRDLAAAGCKIIVDDVIYLDESPVHDGQPVMLASTMGLIAQAVNDVTAAGVNYFSSAGNEGQVTDLTSGTWEGNFNPNGTPGSLAGAGPVNNFGDGGQSILVEFGGGSGTPVVLHWADPLTFSGNDYDIYVMNGALTSILDASADVQDGAGGDDEPIEYVGGGTFTNERLVIAKFADDGTSANGTNEFLSLRVFRGELANALATTGSTHGHSSSALAFSVAATPAAAAFGPPTPNGPFPGPFTSANQTEWFSSDGPRRILFDANNTPITAGNVTSTGGLLRQKPDVTAADGVMCAAPGFNTFYGTSAAAPHAAAIAALLLSSNMTLTTAQVRTALITSAIDIQTAGVDRDSGAGIVMAFQALQAIGATPAAFLQQGTITFTETSGDSDGFIEPCERVNFTIPLNNAGAVTATNISATLTTSTPNVTIVNGVSAYPNIPAGGTANNTTPFTAIIGCNVACGTTVNFTLTTTYTGGVAGSSPLIINFSYLLGAPGTPVTFSYTGPPIPIPDGLGSSGTTPGAPVVAPLIVAGVPNPIFDVNLRIDGTTCNATVGSTTVGIDHTWVSDLEVSLVAPSTTTLKAIDNTDGSGNNFCQTLLDDETANPSIQTVISSMNPFTGTFKPANPLSVFKGQNANGTWNLRVQDFAQQDTGNLRAYSLIITPVVCQTTACTVTCPANITTTATGPGGATVNYPAPTTSGGCGTVTCVPPSGSTFVIGNTTVTCTPQSGSACSFMVTVNPNVVPSTLTGNFTDPLACTGPGNVITGTIQINNPNAAPQAFTLNTNLTNLIALPGSCTVSGATGTTCTINVGGGGLMASGTIPANGTATVQYQAQVTNVATGTVLTASSTATVGGVAATPNPLVYTATVNCPAVGPGTLVSDSADVSDQKAGSVLVYNLYSSSIAAPNAQNTRIAITNTHPGLPIAVHLFFVDGATCSIADSLVCLTPNQTASFLASDIDPGTTGYIVAVASDLVTGCPVDFNYLIGDEYVKLSSGHAANLAAESFAAIAGGLPACNGLSVTALLSFDGTSYNRAPRVLAASNIPSRADGNDTVIVLNRFGGSLAAGASTLGALFGILYDDAENPLSFTFTAGVCQFRSSLSSSFPRVAPRFEQFIPAGRSGWAKFYSQSDIALLGAQLNFNANAGTAANAFNQGHNLHKLTLTSAATLTIPIFPPNC